MKFFIVQFIKINPIGVAEILNNCERYPGLQIKFRRPTKKNPVKKVTIKILRSGKINFDGGNSEKEIEELYYWLQDYIYSNQDVIIYDKENDNFELSDCSDDSIYDDYEEEDLWWHGLEEEFLIKNKK